MPELIARGAGPRRPLVAIGPWLPGSGYTRVLLNILARLGDAYEVHFIGTGYKGPRLQLAGATASPSHPNLQSMPFSRSPESGEGAVKGSISNLQSPIHALERSEGSDLQSPTSNLPTTGVTVYPCNLHGGDIFGARQGAELARTLGARLVLLVNEIGMVSNSTWAFPRHPQRPALVAYLPLDGTLPDDTLLAPLAAVDRLVAFTEFGRQELDRALPRLAARDGPFTGTEVTAIPLGVDTRTFYPLAGTVEAQLAPGGRREARRRLFPDEPGWQDAFVVLNANRPMPRKRIDLTLAAFARFARDKPPAVRLRLHHAIMRAEERETILALAHRLGIADRLHLTPPDAPPLSDEWLNLVYNACDVGLNTAMGEGWGMVSFEHAATGAAQVVPRHSACTELWQDAAELVETTDTGVPDFSLLSMRTVSIDGVTAALECLYADREHLRALSLAAYRNATHPRYRWDHIAHQWRALFDDLLATPGPGTTLPDP